MSAPTRNAVTAMDQMRFAQGVTMKLRESRRRQKLTQAEVASRTRGLVSKAALANYETGHRSLRIDVLWVIARALGEDLGQLLARVENEVSGGRVDETAQSLRVRVGHLAAQSDPRLDVVRRWFELRELSLSDTDTVVILDSDAVQALADLTQTSPSVLRELLTEPTS